MDLRRQALMQGRPLSQQEMQGVVSEGVNQMARQKAIFEELALQKQIAADQYNTARKAMKRDKKNGMISGIGNAATAYLIGKQAGLWG
jgi:capsule polysaccharide export protein KpsE/RkpR